MSKVSRAHSIALPIFALVIASVAVAALVIFAVTFSGPPPRLPVRSADTVAQIFRSGIVPPTGDGPQLRYHTSATAPGIRDQFRRDSTAASNLATALDVPVADVVALTLRPPEDEHGSAFGRDFILGWHKGASWRIVETPRPLLAPWHLKTLVAMLLAILALAVPAWALARTISRPLAQVARAAERARAGTSLPDLPQGGAREVRALSQAVAAMHDRLTSHAENRTTMLAAITHDLGTPLSRLAYWVEQLPEDARTRAAADIDEMRAMLGDVLRFARDARPGAVSRIDLGSVLDSLVDDLAVAGTPIELVPGPRVLVSGDAPALRRLFANLIENAIRYGDRARVGWDDAGDSVVVHVEDDGPGFDAALGHRLFEPFVRGDPSRNRVTGGTGLGLAIVRSLAEAHGGTVTLGQASGGGARVEVTLPAS